MWLLKLETLLLGELYAVIIVYIVEYQFPGLSNSVL